MPTDLCLAHLVRRDWLTDGPLNVSARQTHLANVLQSEATPAGFHRCGSNSPIRLWG